jgi:O-antigen/teichoic acid export membrane protein
MPIPFSDNLTRLLSAGWRIVFKEPLPEGIGQHLDRLLYFGAGMLSARILSAVVQILLGRTLGPTHYGELTIVTLLAGYLSLPIAGGWGLAFTRVAATQDDPKKSYQALKALLLICLGFGLAVAAGAYLLRDAIGAWLNLSRPLMNLTLFMSLLYAGWILAKQIAQAFQSWGTYIVVDLGWAATLLVLVIVLTMLGRSEVTTIGAAFLGAYLLSSLAIGPRVRRIMGTGPALEFTRPILQHGGFLLLNSVIGISAYSIDRVLLQRFLGPEEVGLYQAHFISIYGLVISLMTLVLTYAFPLFCRDDRNAMGQNLKRIGWLQYPFTLMLSALVGLAGLYLYDYPISAPLFICFCLFGSIQFHGQIKAWYLSSKGAAATRRVLGSQVLYLAADVLLLMGLVGRLGMLAGGVSLLGASVAALVYLNHIEKELAP